jgi:putative FmdB family regulatory protein
MPTYEYLCKSCGARLEVQQRFTDDPLTECPTCEGPLRKVFGNVGIAFKGSGFYKTDSRSGSSSSSKTTSTSDASSGDSSSAGGSTDSSGTPSTAATPSSAATTSS